MNIWAWVEAAQGELRQAGKVRLAELIELIPQCMSDNEHEQLDALMPEALALARDAQNPWLELFFRHWNLQSRILQRQEVRPYLAEAVELIEFAARPATSECPQSVCVTQDLANCYANLDGPGFAAERLAVAQETLQRIGPKWPCFTCISSEYAAALIDAGRGEAALTFLEVQRRALLAAGQADRQHDMSGTEIDALIVLGRGEAALALNEKVAALDRGEGYTDLRRIDRARILARLGRTSEAHGVLPPFERIVRTPSQYEPYADGLFGMVRGGVLANDRTHDQIFQQMIDRLAANGVARRAFQLCLWQGELAIGRGRRYLATRSIERARGLLAQLRAKTEPAAQLASLERLLERSGLKLLPLPESPRALLDAPRVDLETDLERFDRGLARWPENLELQLAACDLLLLVGERTRAIELLYAARQKCPGEPSIGLRLLKALATTGARIRLDRVAQELLAETQDEALVSQVWLCVARAAVVARDLPAAQDALLAAFARVPEDSPRQSEIRLLLAQVRRALGAYPEALELLAPLTAPGMPAGAWDWERMLVATLAGELEAVIDSAQRVGFPLGLPLCSPAGVPLALEPLDLGLCRVLFEAEQGATLYALRTGPVTARILEVAPPKARQHFGDEVVFDPVPRQEMPLEPGEGSFEAPLFELVEITASGGFTSTELDGVHPGESVLAALDADLTAQGCRFELRSDDDYQLEDAETGARIPGFYALVAIPAFADPTEIREVLRRHLREAPVIWPGLTQRLGDRAEAAVQARVLARFAL